MIQIYIIDVKCLPNTYHEIISVIHLKNRTISLQQNVLLQKFDD